MAARGIHSLPPCSLSPLSLLSLPPHAPPPPPLSFLPPLDAMFSSHFSTFHILALSRIFFFLPSSSTFFYFLVSLSPSIILALSRVLLTKIAPYCVFSSPRFTDIYEYHIHKHHIYFVIFTYFHERIFKSHIHKHHIDFTTFTTFTHKEKEPLKSLDLIHHNHKHNIHSTTFEHYHDHPKHHPISASLFTLPSP